MSLLIISFKSTFPFIIYNGIIRENGLLDIGIPGLWDLTLQHYKDAEQNLARVPDWNSLKRYVSVIFIIWI